MRSNRTFAGEKIAAEIAAFKNRPVDIAAELNYLINTDYLIADRLPETL